MFFKYRKSDFNIRTKNCYLYFKFLIKPYLASRFRGSRFYIVSLIRKNSKQKVANN